MRAILISLLVLGVCGCDSVGDPIETGIGMVLVAMLIGFLVMLIVIAMSDAATPLPDVSPPVEQPLPDVDTVKKALTPGQLEFGDPIENSIGMVLVPIPAGEFMMGSRVSAVELAKRFDTSADYFEDQPPRHPVTLTKPFYLGATEVTQGQWKAVMGTTPWKGDDRVKAGDDYPATDVSWEDAVEFCRKLSEIEGVEYRLPTEAEWEYACRAGTTTLYSFGDDESQLGEYAWYSENADDRTHIVGQKKPNPCGLYDMHGNVCEWCQDCHGEYPSYDVTDPVESDTYLFPERVLRGGSILDDAPSLRSADRGLDLGDDYRSFVGFRAARTYP